MSYVCWSFQSTSDASIDNSLVHSFGGRDVFNFTASQLRIQPKRTHHNPCVTMTLVTCPARECLKHTVHRLQFDVKIVALR